MPRADGGQGERGDHDDVPDHDHEERSRKRSRSRSRQRPRTRKQRRIVRNTAVGVPARPRRTPHRHGDCSDTDLHRSTGFGPASCCERPARSRPRTGGDHARSHHDRRRRCRPCHRSARRLSPGRRVLRARVASPRDVGQSPRPARPRFGIDRLESRGRRRPDLSSRPGALLRDRAWPRARVCGRLRSPACARHSIRGGPPRGSPAAAPHIQGAAALLGRLMSHPIHACTPACQRPSGALPFT